MTLSHDTAPGGICKSHKTQLGRIDFSGSTYKPMAATLGGLSGDPSMGRMSVRELGREDLSAGPI